MNLGEKIKRTRLVSGMSQKELARKSEITVSFLSQVERDRATPSLKSLRNIARALNIKVNHLLDEDNSPPKRIKLINKNTNERIILENGGSLELHLD